MPASTHRIRYHGFIHEEGGSFAGNDVAGDAAADAAEDRQDDDADDRPLLAAVVVGPLRQQRAVERVGGRRDQVDDHEVAAPSMIKEAS